MLAWPRSALLPEGEQSLKDGEYLRHRERVLLPSYRIVTFVVALLLAVLVSPCTTDAAPVRVYVPLRRATQRSIDVALLPGSSET